MSHFAVAGYAAVSCYSVLSRNLFTGVGFHAAIDHCWRFGRAWSIVARAVRRSLTRSRLSNRQAAWATKSCSVITPHFRKGTQMRCLLRVCFVLAMLTCVAFAQNQDQGRPPRGGGFGRGFGLGGGVQSGTVLLAI